MLTPAIINLMITNIVVTSAALMAASHTSLWLSALTSNGRPAESDISSDHCSRHDENLLVAA
jgi:hypothetical protein